MSLDSGKHYFCSEHHTHFRDRTRCRQITEEALRQPPPPVDDWREEAMRDYAHRHDLNRHHGETAAQQAERARAHMRNLPPVKTVPTDAEREAEIARQRHMVRNFGPLCAPADIAATTRRTANPDTVSQAVPREPVSAVRTAPPRGDLRQNASPAPPQATKPTGGTLARLAGQLCANPAFRDWLGLDDEAQAAEHVRLMCGIQSRAELDHNPAAARIFHDRIRRPFAEQHYEAA